MAYTAAKYFSTQVDDSGGSARDISVATIFPQGKQIYWILGTSSICVDTMFSDNRESWKSDSCPYGDTEDITPIPALTPGAPDTCPNCGGWLI
jgi:hypothetical protein